MTHLITTGLQNLARLLAELNNIKPKFSCASLEIDFSIFSLSYKFRNYEISRLCQEILSRALIFMIALLVQLLRFYAETTA